MLTITVTAESEFYNNYTAADIQATGATCLKIVGPINSYDILRVSGSLNATLGQVDLSETTFTDLNSSGTYFLRNGYLCGIVLPEGLTAIPNSFFSDCTNLSSVNIPSTVTRIGSSAFDQCKSLPATFSINVSGPLNIESSAFLGVPFTSISITAGGDVALGSGYSKAFTSSVLTSFELHTPGKLTTSDEPFTYATGTLITATLDARGVGSTMGIKAFQNCRNLTSVTLPAGLTSLGQEFFEECTSLTSVTIPSTVTSIGQEAFRNCTQLGSLTMPSSLTSIGQQAFYGCTGLGTLDFSQTALTTIGQEAFRGCTAVTNISLPSGITSVGSNAFRNCTLLTALDLSGATITELPTSMCEECHALSSILLPATVTSIGSWAFYNCKALTSLDLSQMSFTAIPLEMCYGCEQLSTLLLPANYTTIAEGAFYNCTALTAFNIPSGVTSIGKEAFYQCSSLQSITIPSSVTDLGTDLFENCTALTTANVQANITALPGDFFYHCTSLANVTLPSGLTSLGNYCFSDCGALNNISLPNGVTTIGSSAFKNSAITSIDLPSGLTTIGSSAFESCYNLTTLEVPEGITEIPSKMLQGCSKLQSLYLPSTVTTIGDYALRVSWSDWSPVTLTTLVDVHVAATTPPTVGYHSGVRYSQVTLYVPEASIAAYDADGFWNTFKNIYADQYDLSTLDDTEFALLQTLYTKLGGSNWTHNWTFGATKAETAIPYGVKLNEGHVVQLLLNNNNLSCTTLPQELMQFPNVWFINVSGNHLSGRVDDLFAGMAVNTALTHLNLSDNQLTGNIGAMRQYVGGAWIDKLPNLFVLKAARNKIRDVKPVLPTHVGESYWGNSNYFDISGQDLTDQVNPLTNQPYTFSELAATNREDFVDIFPSILAFKHSNSPDYCNTDYVLRTIDSSEPWGIRLYKNFYSGSNTAYNVYEYKTGVSAWNYAAPNTQVYLTDNPANESDQHRMIIRFDFIMGDVDYSNVVNVSDLQKLVNFAIQPEAASTSTPFNLYAANTRTADDADARTIDVLDVIEEVNLLLEQDIEPTLAKCDGIDRHEEVLENQACDAVLSIENGELVLKSVQPVAALDLTLSGGSVRWSSNLNFFTKKSRGHRTIIYSLMGDVLPAGRTVLGSVDGDAVVQQAQLCDQQGELIATSLNGGTATGLDERLTEEAGTTNGSTYYDMQGCRIDGENLQRGIYIMRQQGQQGKKVIK